MDINKIFVQVDDQCDQAISDIWKNRQILYEPMSFMIWTVEETTGSSPKLTDLFFRQMIEVLEITSMIVVCAF